MTDDEARSLQGKAVRLTLKEPFGSDPVGGKVVGTLEALDGLVVVVEPTDSPGSRQSFNYQMISSAEVQA